MRLYCHGCGKSVSTEVPDETVVRACLFCPECLAKMDSAALNKALESLEKKNS